MQMFLSSSQHNSAMSISCSPHSTLQAQRYPVSTNGDLLGSGGFFNWKKKDKNKQPRKFGKRREENSLFDLKWEEEKGNDHCSCFCFVFQNFLLFGLKNDFRRKPCPAMVTSQDPKTKSCSHFLSHSFLPPPAAFALLFICSWFTPPFCSQLSCFPPFSEFIYIQPTPNSSFPNQLFPLKNWCFLPRAMYCWGI